LTDLEHRLVFQEFEHRVSQVFKEQPFDQLVHGASSAAVRERDVRVFNFSTPAPRTLDPLEERRSGKLGRHTLLLVSLMNS
jgi:hypothetical protein